MDEMTMLGVSAVLVFEGGVQRVTEEEEQENSGDGGTRRPALASSSTTSADYSLRHAIIRLLMEKKHTRTRAQYSGAASF